MCYFDTLEQKFRDWLEEDQEKWNSDDSRSSYVSGMRSLISWLDGQKDLWDLPKNFNLDDFQDYLKNINSEGDVKTLFSAALNIIQKEIDKKDSKFSKSTLQNYKSYLVAFEEFILNKKPFDPNAKGLYKSHRNVLRYNGSAATYYHDELISEFIGRITSQDRISTYKDILFPISLIRSLWPDETKVWAKGVCENIYLIVEDENGRKKEIKINEVDSLQIDRTGTVTVFCPRNCQMNNPENDNKVGYTLCTSYSDPYETLRVEKNELRYYRKQTPTLLSCKITSEGYKIDKNQNIRNIRNRVVLWHVKKLKTNFLGGIVIDHDVPISLVLVEKSRFLEKLKMISDLYRSISKNHGLKVTAKNARDFPKCLTDNERNQLKDIKFPYDDLAIIGKCKLVLMGGQENSIKSDN